MKKNGGGGLKPGLIQFYSYASGITHPFGHRPLPAFQPVESSTSGGLEAFLVLRFTCTCQKRRKPFGGLACTIGAVEGLQMAVCRLFGNPKGNICDVLSGFPLVQTSLNLRAVPM